MSRWILVVEDEAALGEMICDNLQLEGYGVEHVQDGVSASTRIAKGGLDLVILDIMLPGKSGFEVLADMRAREDQTPVLILSARSADADRIHGLELQADDYLSKPFNLKELLLRVAALLRRNAAISPGLDVFDFAGNQIDFRSHRARTHRGEETQLTPSEVKLLRLMATRAGEVLTRRELVDQLFGSSTPPTTRSLDNLVLHLRRLFEHDSKSPQHIHTVRGVGLRFTAEQET